MSQSLPDRSPKFLRALAGCLLACALPLVAILFVWRILSRVFRLVTRRRPDQVYAQADIAQARRRVQKAAAGYNATKRKYTRASAKLAKAQADLAAMQGKDSESALPRKTVGPNLTRFLIGLGTAVVDHLIDRNLRKGGR